MDKYTINNGRVESFTLEQNHQPDEASQDLWPMDEYRAPDERVEAAADHDLWPRDEYRPADQKADQAVERRLYPRDALRPLDERAGHQTERHIWTWYHGS